jgi:hypothetical protein
MTDRFEAAYRLGRNRGEREMHTMGRAPGIRPVDPVVFRAMGAAYLDWFERGYCDGAQAAKAERG